MSLTAAAACFMLLQIAVAVAAKSYDTVTDFSVDGMDVALDKKACGPGGPCTYAVASLTVVGNATNRFDFLQDPKRKSFLGEISGLRAGYAGGAFVDIPTKGARATALPAAAGEYAAATIALKAAKGTPSLGLERRILKASAGFSISLTLKNQDTRPIEVGGFGVGLPFVTMGNVGGKHSLDLFADMCSFIDPQIGTGGFVSVTRMTGLGSVLLVVPEHGTDFQAYRSAAGGFEFTSLSKAYALKEWINASKKKWVEPTAATIAPGKSLNFTYRVLRANSIREKDDALAAAGFPVLQAVSSYTIATDMRSAQLHVLPPRGSQIAKVTAEPAGAMTFSSPAKIGSKGFFAVHTTGVTAGRVRVTVAFTDGSASVASYFVLPPFDQHMRKYTTFMTETAWYTFCARPVVLGVEPAAQEADWRRAVGQRLRRQPHLQQRAERRGRRGRQRRHGGGRGRRRQHEPDEHPGPVPHRDRLRREEGPALWRVAAVRRRAGGPGVAELPPAVRRRPDRRRRHGLHVLGAAECVR